MDSRTTNGYDDEARAVKVVRRDAGTIKCAGAFLLEPNLTCEAKVALTVDCAPSRTLSKMSRRRAGQSQVQHKLCKPQREKSA